MNKDVFEYGGYHFKPSRLFNEIDGDYFKITHNLRTDKELGFTAYTGLSYQKRKYDYDEFYKKSTEKKCDIFICVENQKSYMPCVYELQEYIVG